MLELTDRERTELVSGLQADEIEVTRQGDTDYVVAIETDTTFGPAGPREPFKLSRQANGRLLLEDADEDFDWPTYLEGRA